MYSSIDELKTEFERTRAELNFFDANAWFGYPLEPVLKDIRDTDALAAQLDSSCIGEAIVTHTSALHYGILEGNEATFSAIANHDRLYGGVVLAPDLTGEIGRATDYIDEAIKRKARIVRLFPKQYTFSLDRWCIGAVLEALQERRLPLMLWHSETDWSEIHSLCQDYPDLRVIIEGTGRKMIYDIRMFDSLLPLHKNLHLELHCFTNCRVLEDIVSRFGAEQLIFGSYLPYKEPAVTTMLITHSAIPEEAKRLIANGNIRRLLGEIHI